MIRDDALCAPTVGTFVPTVSRGDHLRPGQRFGRLRRVCRWKDVVVPPGVEGYAAELLPPYSPVEYGTVLLHLQAEGGCERRPEEPLDGDHRTVLSEVEGTLYQRPTPDGTPFAPQGARVRVHQIIALVEVMKTFTPIRSPISGVVRHWLVGDGSAIPLGAPLAEIIPDSATPEEKGQAS